MSEGRAAGLEALRAGWAGVGARERRLIAAATFVVAVALLWAIALRPAINVLREAPQQLAALDDQLQGMQLLATEARELRATPPLDPAQAAEALKAATAALGDKARLTLQGNRATVVLQAVSPSALRDWLHAARTSARARAVEASLARAPTGLSGTVVLIIGGGGA